MSTTTTQISEPKKLRLVIPNRVGWISGFQSLSQYLSEVIGFQVEVLPVRDFDEVEMVLLQGQAELGVLTSHFPHLI